LVAARNSRSGAPSNLEPMSSRSSLMFLSVNGTAQSYGAAEDVPSRYITSPPAARSAAIGRSPALAATRVTYSRREMAVTIDDVRDLTAGLPRSYEVLVRGGIKFRVGRIVYLAFSRNETLMGFAFPKDEREAALETYPDKFLRPKPSDMRYRWLVVRLEAIDKDELRELVFDAWRMVVPKKLASLSDDELRQQGVA